MSVVRYLVLSDVHGRDLTPIQNLVEDEAFDALLFLGDLDLMRSIRQLKTLATWFAEERKEAVLVPGNHDHALYANLDISSGTLRREGVSMAMLQRELEQNNDLEQFLTDLVEGRDPESPTPHSKTLSINQFPTLVVHGGVTGALTSFPDCPATIQDLWYRLRTKQDYRDTFAFMGEHGYDLLLRGHDHQPTVTTQEDGIQRTHVDKPTAVTLASDQRHIITAGAYYDGWYTSIDAASTPATVTFHRV